ncbi:MAG: tyrosine-type recombinase/integrase [Terrimicrobiaceae bacterium]|nr:tyrosine-type recombinase/integrase [Terrimicrobiaceae bacterium]
MSRTLQNTKTKKQKRNVSVDLSKFNASQIAQFKELVEGVYSAQQAQHKKPRKARRQETVKYLSEDQLEKFFSVIKDPRDLAMFRVIYHRGLRAREVGALQLADWSIARDRMRFRRLKGSNGGEYHLTSREVRCLKAWLRVRGSEPGPLFPSRLGKGISQQMLDVLMKKYGGLAGLPADLCHTHVLKHSCGTHLLNRGESIEDVQDHLGHSNIQNTLVYAKYSVKRRAVKDQRLRNW